MKPISEEMEAIISATCEVIICRSCKLMVPDWAIVWYVSTYSNRELTREVCVKCEGVSLIADNKGNYTPNTSLLDRLNEWLKETYG